MFLHHFKYSLKTLFKNKMLIFWTFIFPILLGTFFYLAFHEIENSETFKSVPIAILKNEEWLKSDVWKQTMENLSKEGDNQLFDITYTDLDQAKELLEDDTIVGYLLIENNEPKIVVKREGTSETIFKNVIDEVSSTKDMITEYIAMQIDQDTSGTPLVNAQSLFEKLYQDAMNILNEKQNIVDKTSSSLSYTMIEYYTLIAMTCLYGGILGMVAINQNLANMSHNGKRVAISPAKKKILILSSALAGYIVQLIGVALLFLYTIFVIKVDYGNHLGLVIILAMVGSLAGLMLGLCIASVLKTNENTKFGIVLSITMLGCFLSGMMGITMKYLVDKNVGFINLINPANMITDGLYSLYYYDTFNRYFFNIVSLLVFSGVLLIISIHSLRRQKYDSI